MLCPLVIVVVVSFHVMGAAVVTHTLAPLLWQLNPRKEVRKRTFWGTCSLRTSLRGFKSGSQKRRQSVSHNGRPRAVLSSQDDWFRHWLPDV
jgi:hypothetical protein